MWNGAGSVSPAGRACDWTGPCHCESCVARRGEVVLRDTNELTQERAAAIADSIKSNEALMLAREQLKMWAQAVELYEWKVKCCAETVRAQIAINADRFGCHQ